jgi:pilus assembly protein TadC
MAEPALLPAAAAALAVALLLPGRPGPQRLSKRRSIIPTRWSPPTKQLPPATRRLHRAVAVVGSVGVLLLLGVPLGVLPAAATFVGIPFALSRLEPAETRRRSARIVADLPLAVDLLAACLRAGRPPRAAIGVVGKALSGPLSDLLIEVERRLDLGTDPIEAWSCLLAEPACAGFARATQRALRSGAPLAKTLEHQANDVRQARRWTAEEHARAVESRSVVPLGLCFLPAFILLGIVPTIAASLSGILDLLS